MTAVPAIAGDHTARPVGGDRGDPPWARPALLALLAATALLYLWGLGASGWANAFYSAAVQAGSQSWKAFFFGSSDAANFITVDKTPASLWPMTLSVRIFGLSSWSILVPQALMGVATTGVLYATVRRRFHPAAGLLAGAVFALTPVAALMFRFNNPDALLVLLLTLSAYGMLRAQERGSTRWLVLAGSLIGWAFLAKMLQAFLVVPGFALTYLVTAPVPLRRRIGQLALAGVAMVVSAGWWVAAVALVPEDARPYAGGSQNNSVMELALGYNGLGRITGDEVGGLGNLNQDSGWGRMFGAEIGGQVAWLLPAALLLLAAGLWITRRAPRTNPVRAAFLLWGSWLVVTIVIFSHMQGIFHAYYTVALAPAIGALTGMGCHVLWRRPGVPASAALAAAVAGTSVWAYTLLGRSAEFLPWLRGVVLVVGIAGAAALLVVRHAGRWPVARRVRLAVPAAALAVLASLAGPAAYAVDGRPACPPRRTGRRPGGPRL
ncbi:glycosyltransferase family 39 protein, partial [Microtetraspora sp. AC03309]|uniref:glycosyltransferase family 39 protein n=1 Tax=Microtetraspora sp. AC03309 TaxID=2779376 RepID=UPI001E6306FF